MSGDENTFWISSFGVRLEPELVKLIILFDLKFPTFHFRQFSHNQLCGENNCVRVKYSNVLLILSGIMVKSPSVEDDTPLNRQSAGNKK
jgi:hypothetical protein